MKIPTSVVSLPFPKAFLKILCFHAPQGGKLWDCTSGERHSWSEYFRVLKNPGLGLCSVPAYDITFTDLKKGVDFRSNPFEKEFPTVYFDPPYIWGISESKDERKEDYGDYCSDKASLQRLIQAGFSSIRTALILGGKVLFKYTDVFYVKEKSFHFGPTLWGIPPEGFEVVDHFIIPHHNINPTAYQVKDRPCSVGNHSYLTVMRRVS